MTSIREAMRQITNPPGKFPAGIYHFQSKSDVSNPYRLHLRIEPDGQGLLIINASTVLHLNQTATEYAYHVVQQTPKEKAIDSITARYHTTRTQALIDYQNLLDRINLLIHTPDLDPVDYLSIDRYIPYSGALTAPYRLDCALTYRLRDNVNPEYAPTKRVKRELSTREWNTVLEKAWNAGIPHIVFTGGEPTLRDDLPEIIQVAEALGQVSGLLSDGIPFAEHTYLDKILQTGLDHILLLYQHGDSLVEKALMNLIESDVSLAVHLTLSPSNTTNAVSQLEQLARIGVRSISLSAISMTLSNSLVVVRNRAAELGLAMVWDLPVPYSSINPITLDLIPEQTLDGAGKAWLYIEPDGDVLPAQGINRSSGNFLYDSWDSIWKKTKAL